MRSKGSLPRTVSCSSLRQNVSWRVMKSKSYGVAEGSKQCAGCAGIIRVLGLLVWMSLGLDAGLSAQVATADVLGTITDSTGSLIPGASVRLQNINTNEKRSFTSGQDGTYTFSDLQPGHYTVTIAAAGFKAFVAKEINLAGGDRDRVDARLELGAATDQIEVTATPSALQTDSTDVGTTLTAASVQDVPLNGRNFIALVETTVGVNAGSPNSTSNGGHGGDRRLSSAVSANGQGEGENNELIDGMDNNSRYEGVIELRPSVEAIEQVRTDINLYTAEVGRTAGAVINVITKSGGDAFHGSLFEYFRNDITDARNFFATTNILSHKPELRQNQYGGSISGPIVREKLFFFADYEGYRRIDGTQSVYTNTVPSASERTGNLADIGGPNLTGKVDPTALAYFNLYPLPNQPGTQSTSTPGLFLNNFLYDPPAVQNASLADARIDDHIGTSDTLFGRYSYNNTVTLTPPFYPSVNGVFNAGPNPPAPGTSDIITHNVVLGYTHIYTPKLLMELKAGYTYFDDVVLSLNNGRNLNDTAPYLIPGANECFVCSGLASIALVGAYGTIGDPAQQPILDRENNYQVLGNLTYSTGKHTLKAGGALVRRHVSNVQVIARSALTFSGATPVIALENFFAGEPFNYTRNTPLAGDHYQTWESSAFAQDDWAATTRLHFNLGMRYDVFTPPAEKDGRNANLNLQTLKLDVGDNPDLYTSYVDVAPRFGFAYQATQSVVVRGGFGLTYFQGDNTNFFQIVNPPYNYNSGTVKYTTPLSAGVAVPTAQSTTALTGALTAKTSSRQQYAEQFNLLLQKEVKGNVFTAGYVGILGRRLLTDIPNLNVPAPSGPSPAGTPAPAAPYAAALPNVNTIDYRPGSAESSYHSLQLSAERRFTKGFAADLNYTFAHALDDANNVNDQEAAFGLLPSQSKTYDYGNTFIDIKHRIAGTFTYQLPFGKEGSPAHRRLAGGWQVNGLGFWQTGLPITISSAYTQGASKLAQINLPGITVDRPSIRGSAYTTSKGIGQYLNPASFIQQPLGTAGNAGRNQFFGPRLRRGDLSVFKNVNVTEKVVGQFRVECFNITNTPNFGQPNAQIGSYSTTPDANGNLEATTANSFGQITTTAIGYSGRQVQFVLRVSF